MKKIWTNEDIEYLQKNYHLLSKKDLSLNLNRTEKSITHMINRMNLANMSPKWTDAEIQIIKDNCKLMSRSDLANLLPGRSIQALSTKLWELNLTCINFTRLDDSHDEFIKNNYLIKTDIEIASILNIKDHQVCNIRHKLNLFKSSSQVRGPTSIEILVSTYLDSLNIDYIYNKKLNNISATPDFLIGNKIIEVNGDYWHGNPKIYKFEELNDIQARHVTRDLIKYKLYKNHNFDLLVIWEKDIKDNFEKVKIEIFNFLYKNTAPLESDL